MTPDDFDFLAKLLKDRTGYILTRDKGYLVENRLLPVIRNGKFRGLPDVIATLRRGDTDIGDKIVDAMMVKDTSFFRDWKPFEHFRSTVLPNLIKTRANSRTFRVLSAGVSTGQEAYSIAMLIREHGWDLAGWNIQIVGVDISRSALSFAQLATYSQFDAQRGMPVRTLLKHFSKRDESWVLNGDIQGMVGFMAWNLLDDIYSLGRFDVVLCRNVLTYFDLQTKFSVLQKIARTLTDDGVLYISCDEAVSGISSVYRPVDVDLGVYAVQRGDKGGPPSLAA